MDLPERVLIRVINWSVWPHVHRDCISGEQIYINRVVIRERKGIVEEVARSA